MGAPALRRSCRSASCRKSLYRAANRKPFGVLALSGYSGSEGDSSELIAFLLEPSCGQDAEIRLTWQISGPYLVEITGQMVPAWRTRQRPPQMAGACCLATHSRRIIFGSADDLQS